MSITRTHVIEDVTPEELAFEFCEMGSDGQAAFFATVWEIARTWPGAGWCKQSSGIIQDSDANARDAIKVLASHLPAADVAYIVAGSKDQ